MHENRPESPTRFASPSPAVRDLTVFVAVLSLFSAMLVATVDAASIGPRLAGETVSDRGLWLYAFAVSIITVVLCVHALGAHAGSAPERALVVATAVLNLSVTIASAVHPIAGWFLPATYLISGLSLGVVADGMSSASHHAAAARTVRRVHLHLHPHDHRGQAHPAA